jgi:hypothetical protein
MIACDNSNRIFPAHSVYLFIKNLLCFAQQVTHQGRLYGSITMQDAGVDGEQIKNQGRWANAGALGLAYLSQAPPKDAMTALAGFQLNEPYLLMRDLVAPPDELAKGVFPWIEGANATLPSNGEVTGAFSQADARFAGNPSPRCCRSP